MLDLSQRTQDGKSDLEHFLEMAAKLNQLRASSKRKGKIQYIGIDGEIRTEWYHSCRWNDRPCSIGKYNK